jgi:uncharacterized coiled-coil DUF342 family protein
VDEMSFSKAKLEEMTHKITHLENESQEYNEEVSHLSDAVQSRDY